MGPHSRCRHSHCHSHCRSHRDGGQAIGLVLVTVVLIAMIAISIGMVGGRLTDKSAAQTAADAAALAGALDGRDAAAAVAIANSAALVEFSLELSGPGGSDRTVRVEVRVGNETATAVASSSP